MQSFQAKMIYTVSKLFALKRNIFKSLMLKPKRGGSIINRKNFSKKLVYSQRMIEEFELISIATDQKCKKHIFFLHGGAYTVEANKGHKDLMEKLAINYDFRISFLDYPKAPEYSAEYTHKIVEQAFIELTITYKEDKFSLLGDSAGGGLALSFLQKWIRKNAEINPEKTVLLSPWLDISLDNPQIPEYEKKEVILDLETLRICGKRYAQDIDLKNPLVSPIYGDHSDLSDIRVFVSNYEIFFPDCLLLEEKIKDVKGTSMSLIIREELIHDWTIFPMPESDETINEIALFLNGNHTEK